MSTYLDLHEKIRAFAHHFGCPITGDIYSRNIAGVNLMTNEVYVVHAYPARPIEKYKLVLKPLHTITKRHAKALVDILYTGKGYMSVRFEERPHTLLIQVSRGNESFDCWDMSKTFFPNYLNNPTGVVKAVDFLRGMGYCLDETLFDTIAVKHK